MPLSLPPTPTVLLQNEGYRLERHEFPRYLRVNRTDVPFLSREHCNQLCGPLQKALDRAVRQEWPLLVDSRAAVRRDSEEYDGWFAHHRRAMVLGFPRVCLLMKTAEGKMQAERMMRSDASLLGDVRVTLDDAEGIAWMIGPSRSTSLHPASATLRVSSWPDEPSTATRLIVGKRKTA